MIKLTKSPEKTKTGTAATLAEAKRQLHIEPEETDDDSDISALIETATELVESDTNSDVLLTENMLEHESKEPWQTLVHIAQAPFHSLQKIEQHNGSAYEEIHASGYSVFGMHNFISIDFDTVPTYRKLKFTFKTGYDDADIPKQLKQAILLKVADLFDPERQSYNAGGLTKNNAYAHLIGKHIRNYY